MNGLLLQRGFNQVRLSGPDSPGKCFGGLGRVTWENDEQAGGMTLSTFAEVLVESVLGEASRA